MKYSTRENTTIKQTYFSRKQIISINKGIVKQNNKELNLQKEMGKVSVKILLVTQIYLGVFFMWLVFYIWFLIFDH